MQPLFRNLPVVTNSMEFQRIWNLPRRSVDLGRHDVTPFFAKPGATMRFFPIQSLALEEAARNNGLFAPIGVGFGKTLITLVLPEVMDSKRTVLLVPPQLKRQLVEKEIPKYAEHFNLPLDRLTIVAYSELSSASKADILDEINPDLVVADEGHSLRHRSAARTKRFLRFMRSHPGCRFVCLSGTMTTRSITDYAHLIELALRSRSPLPLGFREVQDWAGALDVKPENPAQPGVLMQFCNPGENVREGFRRRMVETAGVVATDSGALGTSLVIRRRALRLPGEIGEMIDGVTEDWRIADEELTEATAVARVVRQLSAGFYYRWDWPGGVKDKDWLKARADWHKEVREYLKNRSKPGLDSPGLLAQAAAKGKWLSMTWDAWALVKDRPEPPTVPVWINDFMVLGAVAWLKEEETRSIIWTEHASLGEAIAKHAGLEFYDHGDSTFATGQHIVCSIHSQKTGKNLQDRYSRNLVTTVPPNGTTWEQMMGRTHRPGQEADEVVVDWFATHPIMDGSFQAALDDAKYQEETLGVKQKLLYGTKIML
jgi:hypothetical protein